MGLYSENVFERFLNYVEFTDTCWLWQGPMDRHGVYGRIAIRWIGKRQLREFAHRFAYRTWVAEIPPGLQIDHLCRVTRCVRPSHLEAVTAFVNNERSRSPSALNRRKSACFVGHEFTDENTYVDKTGRRCCRACNRRRVKEWRARA